MATLAQQTPQQIERVSAALAAKTGRSIGDIKVEAAHKAAKRGR